MEGRSGRWEAGRCLSGGARGVAALQLLQGPRGQRLGDGVPAYPRRPRVSHQRILLPTVEGSAVCVVSHVKMCRSGVDVRASAQQAPTDVGSQWLHQHRLDRRFLPFRIQVEPQFTF